MPTGADLNARRQLASMEAHLGELENQLGSPDIQRDSRRTAELGREHSRLVESITVARRLVEAEDALSEAREMLRTEKDPGMRELAEAEIEEYTPRIEELTREFQVMLLPPDPLDGRNLLLEIRAGTGGEEAALFAADLLRMYTRFAEEKGWKTELLSQTESDMGGFREVIISVVGADAYSLLKHESGTHRVQRIPATETQGRIHTSAATVAVLPEAGETDVEIKESDIRIDTMCASGPGGQGVNTTYSAVRLLHLPTNMIVTCQDERSQIKNKAKAMKVLRTRLLERKMEEENRARSDLRKGMVGSGDRSQRIRTYNFPQNRITDHRINLTLYDLENVIAGQLGSLVDALRNHELNSRIEELSH
ncbi:MAG: peptide chain release factor 1 [Candidatus Sumerlaeia bacterium]|nr:peptide chain release factor 1 [Candidatus Sumerlaeia bacterium]